MQKLHFGLPMLFLAAFLSVVAIFSTQLEAATTVQPTQFDVSTLNLINKYRAQRGLHALPMHRKLFLLARQHSSAMAAQRRLSHDGFYQRYELSGFSTCVENVAWNSLTPTALFNGWRMSPGHNANLLNRRIRYAGVSKIGAYSTFFACG